MSKNHATEAAVGFVTDFGDESAYYYVSVFDPVFGGRLIVAKFEWDDGSPDAKHHRDEAARLAELLANAIGR